MDGIKARGWGRLWANFPGGMNPAVPVGLSRRMVWVRICYRWQAQAKHPQAHLPSGSVRWALHASRSTQFMP